MLFMASLYSMYESFCRDEASAIKNKQQKLLQFKLYLQNDIKFYFVDHATLTKYSTI